MRSLERQQLYRSLWAMVPSALILLVVLILAPFSWLLIFTLIPIVLINASIMLWLNQRQLRSHFHSLANVVEGIQEDDFSLRVPDHSDNSASADLNRELNRLGKFLQQQRFATIEADVLLDKLMGQLEVPLLVFDERRVLLALNEPGLSLFHDDAAAVINLSAEQLGLGELIALSSGSIVEHQFWRRSGSWEIRSSIFHRGHQRLTLLMINDLSRALRQEERMAWQKILRVLGHELNNSLASIRSVAESLAHDDEVRRIPRIATGMDIINQRTLALQRFTDSYTQVAKLPTPEFQTFSLSALAESLRLSQSKQAVAVIAQKDIEVCADRGQIEQLLLNLVKNAVEASDPGQEIAINWHWQHHGVLIEVIDAGTGISNPDNLFVPFYTTKPSGTGVGLFLSRQIAEAHGGSLRLDNRAGERGCVASLWLPGRP